ncbi:MAG TPA: hypothetical protein VM327_07925 [Candidatus Thermoplasmatota archaeon]|nr:hypothetical protein [Candidatus Thermoplasmatota archaeon]
MTRHQGSVAQTPPPVQSYLAVRVSQETADGPALPGAGVQAFVLDASGAVITSIPASTDTRGFARFRFAEPVRAAIRATAPGWTREGVVVQVGDLVAFDQVPSAPGFHTASLSERDLFLPLFHSGLALSAAATLTTRTVQPAPDGSLHPPVTTAGLALPADLAEAYLARMVAADVRVHWEDTVSSRAHVAAALAWDGDVWVRGESPGPGLAPGPREASFSGPVPVERPADLSEAHLQAAAILESAAVGEVPLTFEVTLRLAGLEPAGLPAPCHSRTPCLVPPLPPVH